MNLSAYLDRINYSGPVASDLSTLNALHKAHLHSIPFENLDVMLQRWLTQDVGEAFDKLVTEKRGGWCYEMNGLFEWVLDQIGFDVRRVSCGVRRSKRGDAMLGNHAALIVRLDQDYLVDVGFGGAQLYALPLIETTTIHTPLQIALVRLDDGYWRLHEGGPDAAHSYDFDPDRCDAVLLEDRFQKQRSDPDSVFRQNLSVSIRQDNDMVRLRWRMLERLKPGRIIKRRLETPYELVTVLREEFGIDEPEAASLWPQICERHAALFPHE